MAVFDYDFLDEDEQFEFDPAVDVLRFLNPNVQAGHLLIRWQADGGTGVHVDFGPAAFGNVILGGASFPDVFPERLDHTNFVFAGGGQVLIGDDDKTQENDHQANTLVGTAFGDFFLGLGGDDTLIGNAGDDLFSYTGGDLSGQGTTGGYGNDSVEGGDGFDWLVLNGSYPESPPTLGVTVNLQAGTASGLFAGSSITFSGIEAVSASGFNDVLIGNSGANYFDPVGGDDSVDGAGGDDTILGHEGDDLFVGGSGNDWILYDEDPNTGSLFVDLFDQFAFDGFGNEDDVQGIENVRGSAFDDEIFGDGNANILDGGGGEDGLAGRAGNDTLIGGDGPDFADYGEVTGPGGGLIFNLSSSATLGIAPNLAADGHGNFDLLIELEGANASARNDTLIGSARNDGFQGQAGNDSIVGGAGGEDEIGYEDSPGAVNVNLSSGTALDGYGSTDSFSGIEVVFASDGNDTLTGDSIANRIHGRAGNDSIFGLDGNDTLVGEHGVDTLAGGSGSDMFWFFREFGGDPIPGHEDVITDFEPGNDKIRLNPTQLNVNPLERTLQPNEFSAGPGVTSAQDADDRIVYNTTTGEAFYDADGTGGSPAVKIFTLTGAPTLQVSDFDLTNVIRWWDLNDGDTFAGLGAFNVNEDVIYINDPTLSAADFFVDCIVFTEVGIFGPDKGFTLAGTSPYQLHSGNLVFSDGSVFRMGDDSPGTGTDDAPNTLPGGAGDDLLISSGGADSLFGAAGNDALVLLGAQATGDFGNDTLDGGAGGADFVDFAGSVSGTGIVVSLGNETVSGTLTGADTVGSAITLIGIEGALGTDGNDTFIANNLTAVTGRSTDIVQFFEGFDGDDVIFGASGDGRITVVSYRNSEGGVFVDLGLGEGEDTSGGVDSLGFVDGVVGSHFNDVLVGGDGSNTGAIQLPLEFFEGLGGIDFIFGDSGADQVDYTSSPYGVVVNLGITPITGNFYGTGSITVAGGTARDGWDASGGSADLLFEIEEARGSEFGDMLVGGGENERFEGLGGNDFIFGTNGFSSEDNDFVVYTRSTEAVYVNLGSGIGRGLADAVTGGTVGIDTLVSIESARGSDWDDSLVGADGNGGENFEELEGGPGNDTLDGGVISGARDFNIASYAGAPTGVVANLSTALFVAPPNTAIDGYGHQDTLVRINAFAGSSFNDTLLGGIEDNAFDGRAGIDNIHGGDGSDWVFYGEGSFGVEVDLEVSGQGLAFDDWGYLDNLFSIENVMGTSFDDFIIGSSGANILDGGEGFDELVGGAGADTFVYSAPADDLNTKLITDFASVEGDRIHLNRRFLPGLAADGPLTAAQFDIGLGNGYLSTTRIIYDQTGPAGVLYYDADGSGASSAIPIAILEDPLSTGGPSLAASDFMVFNVGALSMFNWSELSNGAILVFDPNVDQLVFDDPGISAADIDVTSGGGDTTSIFSYGGKTVTLNTPLFTLTTTNITFANGSVLVIGDNTTQTANDNGANALAGGNGNDLLFGADGADNVTAGGGHDIVFGGSGNDTLNGGAGIDTLDHLSSEGSLGVIVNMLANTAITVGSVTVQAGSVRDEFGFTDRISAFENVVGTERNDFIMGNSQANLLEGLEASDTLVGGGPAATGDLANDTLLGGEGDDFLRQSRGNDLLDGSAGFDWLQFVPTQGGAAATGVVYGGAVGVSVNLGEYVSDPDTGNTLVGNHNAELVSIEAVVGTAGADVLIGGSFAATSSGTFSEAFRPGAGNDTVHGANSRLGAQGVVDRVDYSDMTTAAVIVNFGVTPFVSGTVTVQGGTARDAAGGTDTLIHVDWAVGTSFNDTLVGGNPTHGDFERFEGRGGNDLIIGGPGGGDEATYHNSPTAVNVNLELGTAADGHGGTDVLDGIERVRGSNFSDNLTGSNSNATEVFIGGGGNDTIDGGTGTGLDFASWQTLSLDNGGINAFLENGSGTVSMQGAGTDTLVNIEGIVGTNHHLGDTLVGGLGDQTFIGRAGFDSLDGGSDSDTARYSGDPSAVVVNLSSANVVWNFGDGEFTVTGGTARDGWGDTWLVPHGNILTLGIAGEGEIEFRRAADPSSAIVGSWLATNAGEAQSTVVITFLSDGTYMLAEDGDSVADPSGQDGMERGTFTWNGGDDLTTLTTVNTNGEWGLSHSTIDSVEVSANTLTMHFSDGDFVLTRVADALNPLVGGWYMSGEDGEDPAVLTVLDSAGNFLFAEDEIFDDPTAQDGIERGTINRDPVTGKFTVDITVDTNGTIGPSTLGHGTDTLANIENAFGSRFDDILVGGTGANHLSGFDGDDEFWIRGDGVGGASGDDTLDGGAGNDHVSYQNVQGVPLNVRFDLGTITGGDNDGSTLTVISVESASGTPLADTFTANTFAPVNGLSTDRIQSFQGMGGNDTIVGAFTFVGMPAVTLLEYTDSPAGVIVNLGQSSIVVGSDTVPSGRARDGFGTTDEFIEVDGVRGSAHDDFLQGGGFGRISFNLHGEYFEGMGGDDTIDGGEVNGGHALVSYENSPESVIVNFENGTAQDGWGGTDTLIGLRHARGSAFNDIFIGSNEDREEWFEGGDGDDTIGGQGQGDNIMYTQATGGVYVNLGEGVGRALDTIAGAGVGVDTFFGAEFVHGSDFADSLVGGGAGGQPVPGQTLADFEPWEVALFLGSEELQGRAGNDTINGGDTLVGSLDIAEYRDSPGAVIVNLGAVAALGVGGNRANDGYGVNGNPAGIDVLINISGAGGGNFDDTLIGGAANDFLAGRSGSDSLVGGAGADYASFESGSRVVVNLGTSAISGNFFDTGNIAVGAGTAAEHVGIIVTDSLSGIENVLGSSGNDTIRGDTGANQLIGESGDDSLHGGDSTTAGGAADTLFGGEGDDVLIQTRGADRLFGGDDVSGDLLAYSVGDLAAVNVNLAAGTSEAGVGNKATVSGIEIVRGTLGNDTLAGGDPLHAPGVEGGIFEIFRPSAGNDTITGMGGAGWRTIADYGGGSDANTSGQAIVAVLGNSNNVGFVNDGRGGFDILVNVDEVRGGAGNDLLVGGSYASSISGTFFESFRGNAGNDTLDGGGSDTVLGSLGALDRAEYGNNTAAQDVVANIGTGPRVFGAVTVQGGQAFDGRGGIDTLIDIDVLQGGAGDDTLAGGNPVNDSFERFEGRAGDDHLDGGSGSDEADYSSSPEGVLVDLEGGTALDGFGGTDELVNIEWVRGSDFNDTLIGSDAGTTRLGGGRGDDHIIGGSGNIRYASFSFAGGGANAFIENGFGTAFDGQGGTDTLENINGLWGSGFSDVLTGGAGDQWFRGQGRSDFIDGGAGEDTVVYQGDPNPGGVIVNLGTTAVVVGLETVAGGTARDGWGGIWGIQGTDTLISIEGVVGSTFSDHITAGAGGSRMNGRGGNDMLVGGAGEDTIDYSDADVAVNVNLTAGTAADGEGGNDSLSGSIERVIGSAGNDTLTGSNDPEITVVFSGEAGDDTINGANGFEFVSWASAAVGVTATLDNSGNALVAVTGMGTDTLINIEGLIGSQSGDSLTGGSGNDYFRGLGGNDTLTGGSGSDTADYSDDQAGVSVNLGAGTATDGSGETDTLSQIENAEGSAFDDTLTGNSQANTLSGGEGDDSLVGGDGDDFIFGGGGIDTASYATSPGEVSVDLVSGTVQDGFGQLDEFVSEVENVVGSDFNDTLTGDGGNNFLEGGNGDDSLVGNAGNDTLDGGANDFGGDTMVGGVGDDTYFADDSADIANITELFNEGTDTLISTASLTLAEDQHIEVLRYLGPAGGGVFGNAGNNTIITLNQGNTMGGGEGSDTISYTHEVNSVAVNLDEGTATGAGGTDTLFAFENAEGGSAADDLSGTDGANVLNGNAGADTMSGGDGNDTYFVDDENDVVIEENPVPFGALLAGSSPIGFLGVGGIADTIVAAIDFTIAGLEGVENLTLSLASLTAISATGNLLDNVLTGNDLGNTLIGGAGDDTLNGGLGADAADYSTAVAPVIVNLGVNNVISGGVTVAGGTARDGSDTVGGAVDTLISIENAKGSAFGDTLVGSGGDNQFLGEAGNDSILGGAGNDLLNGGAGNDVLDGGLNSDALDYSTASVAVNVNIVTGRTLSSEGNDTVRGFENVIGTDFNDTLLGGAAAMLLQGGDGADRLTGGAGGDTLDGGAGNDTMAGGLGNDFYLVDAAPGDVITDTGGIDTVVSTVSYALGSTLDRLALTGTADINGTGNALANQLAGNSGNNVLDGGAGSDTMTGGAGDDTYFVGAGDRVVESADEGDDTVISTVTFLLDAAANTNIENVTLTGIANANINGTAGVNILHGNAGVNVITGGAGSDVMSGGSGNDVFIISHEDHHTAEEFLDGGLGTDTIRFTSVTANARLELSALVASIENVGITNAAGVVTPTTAGRLDIDASDVTSGLMISGHGGDNELTGGTGDDTLLGGGGVDTLVGGDGDDFLLIATADQNDLDNLNPVLYNGGGGANVAIYAGTADIALTNAFILQGVMLGTTAGGATGTTAIDINAEAVTDGGMTLIGNAAGNMLTGTAQDDDLIGNGGNDTLIGGGGDDGLTGGAGTDSMSGGEGADVFHFTLATDYTAAERIDGGNGTDLLVYEGAAPGALTLNGANVVDIELIAVGSAGATINAAGLGKALEMFGGIGNDNLTGTSEFADFINGSDGNDTLAGGGAGVDTLNGGAGNDIILVGSQADLEDSINGGENTDGTEDLDTLRFTATAAGAALALAQATLSNVEQVAIASAAGGMGINAANVDASAITAYSLSIIGNNGANVLTGTEHAAGDVLAGNGGNDTLIGGTGADVLNGGAGVDSLVGGADNDLFLFASLAEMPNTEFLDGGETGNDFDTLRYTGGAANITLGAGVGQINPLNIETIQIADLFGSTVGTAAVNVNAASHAAPLTIIGNNGNNNVTATGGADTVVGNGGNDVITGGAGEDSLAGGDGNDLFLIGDAGDHTAAETVTGGGGTDTIRFTTTAVAPQVLVLSGNVQGIEMVAIANPAGLTTGTVGHGVNASNVSSGLTITGNNGGNQLTGGSSDDSLTGGVGNDVLSGNAGHDTIVGGAGADAMTGGGGDDLFLVSSLAELTGDVINGTEGDNDTLRYTGATGSLVLTGNVSNIDTVQLANALGQTTGVGAINVDASLLAGPLSVVGNNGANKITGTGQDDALIGNGGNDTLIGGAGDDLLSDALGNDSLDGGLGNDTLIGGAGNDLLIWDSADGSIQGGDGSDTLRVDGGAPLNLLALGDLVIENVEMINLAGAGSVISLGLADVLAISGTTDMLRIDGNADDTANIGTGWTQIANQTIGTQVYERYTQGLATLLVDLDMTVTNL